MAPNNFLKVEKNLFGSGLSPIEILVLSQIMEFDRNTGDCFMSNAAMAKNFGVSEKTVSRAVAALEEKKYITRNTKNVQKGKERHIILTKDNLTLANDSEKSTKDKMTLAEKSICPLRKGQNDPIKDNTNKINEEDNMENDKSALRSATSDLSFSETAQEERLIEVAPWELRAMGCKYELLDDNKVRIIDTNKIIRLKEGY